MSIPSTAICSRHRGNVLLACALIGWVWLTMVGLAQTSGGAYAAALDQALNDRNVRFLWGRPDIRPAVRVWEAAVYLGLDGGDLPGASELRDSLLKETSRAALLPFDCRSAVATYLPGSGLSGLSTDTSSQLTVIFSSPICGYIPSHVVFATEIVRATAEPRQPLRSWPEAINAVFCTFVMDGEGNVRLIASEEVQQ